MFRLNRFKYRLIGNPCFWVGMLLYCSLHGQELRIVSDNPDQVIYQYSSTDSVFVAPYRFVIPNDSEIEILSLNTTRISQVSDDNLKRLEYFNENYQGSSFLSYGESAYVQSEYMRDAVLYTAVRTDNKSEIRLIENILFRVPKKSNTSKINPNRAQNLSRSFSNTSPFSNGNWLKIPILQDGIYEINAEYLSSAGIEPSQIDPTKISIWSGHSRMLPLQNSAERHQLVQIPVIIESATNSFTSNSSITFFAQGSSGMALSDDLQLIHERHYYSDTSFVFLSFDAGFTSNTVQEINETGGRVISEVEQIRWKEDELYKSEEDLKSGMNWLGQRFTNDQSLSQQEIFNEEINAVQNGTELNIEIRTVVRSESSSQFTYLLNDNVVGQAFFSRIRSYTAADGTSGIQRTTNLRVPTSATDKRVRLQAQATFNVSSAQGWIDYIRLRYVAPLEADNGFIQFFAPVNEQGLLSYSIAGFNSTRPIVFDITNPLNPILANGEFSGNTFRFSATKKPRQAFIAQEIPFTPEPAQRIANQSVRSIQSYPEYIIITNKRLLAAAEEYQSYRAQTNPELKSLVITQDQIFNEYSSGAIDVVAIRDFLRHLKFKAQQSSKISPSYLLFFGDATYDYKQIEENAEYANQVITFQTQESLDRISSYGSDDFFGLLDDNEGDMSDSSERVDLGIGRFPVNSNADAQRILDKIKRYESAETLGAWRNRFTFLADDELNGSENDGDLHVLNADGTVIRMQTESNGIQFNKIYLPSYPVVVTAEGRRIPAAKNNLIRSINEGSLIVNYSGHGAEQLLTAERVFRSEDIPNLVNKDYPTIFVTATCSFGRYDDDLDQSGAEKLLLHNNGGAVASFTTTRVVYTSSSATGATNFSLNIALSQNMIRRDVDGLPLRLGDIYRLTKSTSNGAEINSRKFILLGDPIMRIGLGQKKASIIRINNQLVSDSTLTFRGLDALNIEGSIENEANFTGEVNVEVYDAPRKVMMLARVNAERPCLLEDCSYQMQNDLLFRGRASVANSEFDLRFLLPKDIQNVSANGRISLFAKSNDELVSASGSTNQIRFNGLNLDAQTDVEGPKIEAWLNDPFFTDGSIVNPSPTLFLELSDPSGINTTGSGIGHELSASLNTSPPLNFDLNQYFVGDLDNFSSGKIEFPLQDLPEGNHILRVRAWDVHNNLSESQLGFEVLNDEELIVRNLYNYPNPMSRYTRFIFEHNQTGNPLTVQIRVFTLSGQPVTKLQKEWIPQGNYATIEWNGRDIDGNAIANGTYLYHAIVKNETDQFEKIEKLVLIR